MIRLKRVKAIKGFGAMLIPASEVDRILSGTEGKGGTE